MSARTRIRIGDSHESGALHAIEHGDVASTHLPDSDDRDSDSVVHSAHFVSFNAAL
ncbi:MAG TPA: hypothetical protein VH572_00360 [Gaiella sp.]